MIGEQQTDRPFVEGEHLIVQLPGFQLGGALHVHVPVERRESSVLVEMQLQRPPLRAIRAGLQGLAQGGEGLLPDASCRERKVPLIVLQAHMQLSEAFREPGLRWLPHAHHRQELPVHRLRLPRHLSMRFEDQATATKPDLAHTAEHGEQRGPFLARQPGLRGHRINVYLTSEHGHHL